MKRLWQWLAKKIGRLFALIRKVCIEHDKVIAEMTPDEYALYMELKTKSQDDFSGF